MPISKDSPRLKSFVALLDAHRGRIEKDVLENYAYLCGTFGLNAVTELLYAETRRRMRATTEFDPEGQRKLADAIHDTGMQQLIRDRRWGQIAISYDALDLPHYAYWVKTYGKSVVRRVFELEISRRIAVAAVVGNILQEGLDREICIDVVHEGGRYPIVSEQVAAPAKPVAITGKQQASIVFVTRDAPARSDTYNPRANELADKLIPITEENQRLLAMNARLRLEIDALQRQLKKRR